MNTDGSLSGDFLAEEMLAHAYALADDVRHEAEAAHDGVHLIAAITHRVAQHTGRCISVITAVPPRDTSQH